MAQLENWRHVCDQHTAVTEFLQHVESEYGLAFDYQHAKKGTPLDISVLIDRFFDVNRSELDRERRALLQNFYSE